MKVAVFLFAGTMFGVGALSPAVALSDLTASAAANVRPNVNFLDRSSRLALSRSANTRLKAFAQSEVEEQTAVANAIVAWTQAVTSKGAAEALGLPPEEPQSDAVDPTQLPALAESLERSTETVLSGRSVAIDEPPPSKQKAMLPAGSDNLSKLSSLHGQAFDRLYKSSQLDALLQLSTLYTAYIQHGDDFALRNLAVRQLPSINRRLAELRDF